MPEQVRLTTPTLTTPQKSAIENYVRASTTSASTSTAGTANVTDFGATGDGTTDDYAAFANAIASLGDAGGVVFVPKPPARYRLSQRLVITTGVSIIGEYHSRNSGIVGATSYPYPALLMGSTLYFDSGVAGILLVGNSDDATGATGGSNWEFQSAHFARVERLNILSAGGGTTATHAIEARCQVYLKDLYIRNFGGDGVRITASASTGAFDDSMYGNASLSTVREVFCGANRGNGFYVVGTDANVILFDTCNASVNTLWGFDDQSLLGNTYINCHCSGNGSGLTGTLGSFKNDHDVALTTYIGCYIEEGGGYLTDFSQATLWIGGQGAQPQLHPDSTGAFILGGGGLSMGQPLHHLNSAGATPVHFWTGVPGTDLSTFAWGDDADVPAGSAFRMQLGKAGSNVWAPDWWNLTYGGFTSLVQYPKASVSPRAYAPSFPQGIFIGTAGVGPRIFSSAFGPPTSGTYNRGDICFEQVPSAGGAPAYSCVSGGTPGTWKAWANLAP